MLFFHEGYTPLHFAVTNNNLRLCYILYKYGANPYIENRFRARPIDLIHREIYVDIRSRGSRYAAKDLRMFLSSMENADHDECEKIYRNYMEVINRLDALD